MKNSDKKIQILLSTYNGEKYLREQLDSYLTLENYGDVKVLIRDDGSSDNTAKILSEYSEKYGFEVVFGENLGLNASMYELMRHRDRNCLYYAFSDQDDVWLPNKVTRGVDCLSKYGNLTPALYVATSYITDEELNIKGHTFIPKKKLSFYNAMVQNVCPGHAQICNRAFIDILAERYSADMMVLDYWSYLMASAVGEVVFDPEKTTLYRQHGSNSIGCEHSAMKILKTRIKRVRTRVSADNAKQLKSLCACTEDILCDEYKKEAERFFKGQKNFFTRLKYLFKSKVYRQTSIETLIFRIMYLFGRYNIKR